MPDEYTEDTEVAEPEAQEPDISEELFGAEDDEEPEARGDTSDEDTPDSFEDLLDSVDPEDVKSGTFDEDSFAEQIAGTSDEDEGSDDQAPEDGDTAQPEGRKIVWRGQEVIITPDKEQELLQKGYDYDQKVGPHQRLAELLEMYPDEAQALNERMVARLSGKPPEVDGTDEGPEVDPYVQEQFDILFREKMGGYIPAIRQTRIDQVQRGLVQEYGQEAAQQIHKGVQRLAQMMPESAQRAIDDPDNPSEYLRTFRMVANSMREAGHLGGQRSAGQPERRAARPGTKRQRASSFRLPSGGKDGSVTEKPKIWDVPDDKFQELVARVKGM